MEHVKVSVHIIQYSSLSQGAFPEVEYLVSQVQTGKAFSPVTRYTCVTLVL